MSGKLKKIVSLGIMTNVNKKRNMFYNCLDMYRLDKNDVNLRENIVGARSEHKSVLRKSRYNQRKSKTQQLEESRFGNEKNYWKLLKKICPSNSKKT